MAVEPRRSHSWHIKLMFHTKSEIVNLGHNVFFSPNRLNMPRTKSELLDILNTHKHGQIRAACFPTLTLARSWDCPHQTPERTVCAMPIRLIAAAIHFLSEDRRRTSRWKS